MRRKCIPIRLLAALAVVPLCTASVDAEEPIDQTTVSRLVSQLNAPSRSEREAAEQRLIEMGTSVLDTLPGSSPDPATNAALVRIRSQLSQHRANAVVTKPMRVSIRGSGPLGEVLADWLDDSGSPRLVLSPDQKRRAVTLDERNVPYWQVIDRIAESAHLWPDEWNAIQGLSFRKRTDRDDRMAMAYPGAFRLGGGPIQVKALPGSDERYLYRVPLEIRAEPNVRPLFIKHAAESGALMVEDEIRLTPFTPQAKYELPVGEAGGTARLRMDFTGRLIEGPVSFIGRFVVTAAGVEQPFQFDISRDAFQPTEQKQGNVTVRLRDVTWANDETIHVGMSVVYANGGPAFESYRTWVYHNDASLRVERASVEPMRIDHEPAFDTVAQEPGALLLRYTFHDVPTDTDNLSFEYHAPTELIEVPFDVRLDDLVIEQ